MPLSGRDAAVLCVLVCCVPLQLWLTQNSNKGQDQRNAEVFRLVKDTSRFFYKWFTQESWDNWLMSLARKYFIRDYSNLYNLDYNDPVGVCPAVEVLNYRNPTGHFGMDPAPRSKRPVTVSLRVGQVVRHKKWGYKGVIIGWDPTCVAPDKWITEMHGSNKHWKSQPNYALLVHTGDKSEPQITYVPQENISPIRNEEVTHPYVYKYFDSYDGAQYIPQPWLRALYPRD